MCCPLIHLGRAHRVLLSDLSKYVRAVVFEQKVARVVTRCRHCAARRESLGVFHLQNSTPHELTICVAGINHNATRFYTVEAVRVAAV